MTRIPKRAPTLVSAAILAVILAILAGSSTTVRAAQRRCSSYPSPGSIAPDSTRLPGWLTADYPVLTRPRHPMDRLTAREIGSSLTASGLVLKQARLMGRAAFGARVFLLPAQHLLAFRLAPARCLSTAERSLEQELRPQLESQYRHWALCVIVLGSTSAGPSCGAANANPEALLYAAGTPGFGVVPNGVQDVTLSYLTAPALTIKVHDDFFLVEDPKQSAPPCALQWETADANVTTTFGGCDYVQLLQPPLYAYRTYVQTTLQTLRAQVSSLAEATSAGDLAAAESDWLKAHETWLDVGEGDGPYSAYGQLGEDLDGTAAGFPQGSASPEFTGFHRVEMDLFQNHDLTTAAADIRQLQQVLIQITDTKLTAALPDTPNGIAAWILRPHEIMEDALRDTLSGDDDYGSGSGVASITADVAASRKLLNVLGPVLAPLAPKLIPEAEVRLRTLQSDCTTTQQDGQWVSVTDLSQRQRQQIDADAGAAAATLSQIPGILTTIGHATPSG